MQTSAKFASVSAVNARTLAGAAVIIRRHAIILAPGLKRRENEAMTGETGWRNRAGAARPELEFNLCCGRALIDPAASQRVRLLIQTGLNWPDAVAIAERHR